MRTLERNKRTFKYCLYDFTRGVLDEFGNRTGEEIVIYKDPVKMRASVSEATGMSNTQQFGNLESYDKVIVTDDMSCPIDESTVLFLDKQEEYTLARTYVVVPPQNQNGTETIEVEIVEVPVPDYRVVRVAKSLNSVSIAVRKIQ